MRSLSSTVSDRPSTWLPSRRVVSKISTASGSTGSASADMFHPLLVAVDLAAHGLAVLVHDRPVIGPGQGTGRSSTEFTGVTSAAVPHTKISSAM